MKHLAMFTQACPLCKKNTFDTDLYETLIPHFGKTLIYVMRCKCGYKMTDIGSFEDKEPVRYELTIEGNLDSRVIKGSMGKVIIPGIIESEGGLFSEGYITNIEGVLRRLLDVLEFIRRYEKPSLKGQIDRRIKRINDTIEGKARLTLIIEDYTGNSAIISGKAKREVLPESSHQ
ncbi:MAG: ZPR1 zinc finger domain-containing protein [Candidatus Woesearchaeota archaeon]